VELKTAGLHWVVSSFGWVVDWAQYSFQHMRIVFSICARFLSGFTGGELYNDIPQHEIPLCFPAAREF
jgi:hypothetical protein